MAHRMSWDTEHSVVCNRPPFPTACPISPRNTRVLTHRRTYLNHPERRFSKVIVLAVFRLDCWIQEGLVPTGLPELFAAIWVENQEGQLNTTHIHTFMSSVRWMDECQIHSASPQMSVIVYFPFKLVKLQQFGVINMLGPSFHSQSTFSWH